jgi:hypothetical protein
MRSVHEARRPVLRSRGASKPGRFARCFEASSRRFVGCLTPPAAGHLVCFEASASKPALRGVPTPPGRGPPGVLRSQTGVFASESCLDVSPALGVIETPSVCRPIQPFLVHCFSCAGSIQKEGVLSKMPKTLLQQLEWPVGSTFPPRRRLILLGELLPAKMCCPRHRPPKRNGDGHGG